MRRLTVIRSAVLVYRGPSQFDGRPILGILTGLDGSSDNRKTGPMAQLTIVPADVAPHEAQRNGADVSVCGSCPLRPAVANGGALRGPNPARSGALVCYVRTGQGPLSTWKRWRDEPVSPLPDRIGPALRLGAYGDPCALPADLVLALAQRAPSVTGYTHAWQAEHAQWARAVCMASVETEREAWLAWRMGWRTYRISDKPLARHEVMCPYSTRDVQCVDCGLCQGNGREARSITIGAH